MMNVFASWNTSIFYWFYSFAHHGEFSDMLIHFAADSLPILVVFGVLWYLVEHHTHAHAYWELAAFFGLSFLVVGIIFALKEYFVLPARPFEVLANIIPLVRADGLDAFPSAHTTFFATLGAAMFVAHRKSGIFVFVLTLVIGLARIAAGVHWPVDILAGLVIGGLVGFFATKLLYHEMCRILKVCIIPLT